MSNRALLLNTPTLEHDPAALLARYEQPGQGYAEVAEMAYRIPFAWLCFFRPEEMRKVSVQPSEGEAIEVELPATSVALARERLAQSLPIFEALAGDAAIARRHWQAALDDLATLPLPYLTLDAIELMFMDEHAPFIANLRAAITGTPASIPAMQALAEYSGDGAVPYSPEAFRIIPKGLYDDKKRIANTIAFDAGFHTPGYALWRLPEGAPKPAPLPRPAPPKPNLETIHGALGKQVRALDKDASIYFGFGPPRDTGPTLRLLITTSTDAGRDALRANPHLRIGLKAAQLEDIARDEGCTFEGIVYMSDETRERDLKNDYSYWLRPEAVVER